MDPHQTGGSSSNDAEQHQQQDEFVFDPEEHQVVTLDEALEIFGDEGGAAGEGDMMGDSDDDEEDDQLDDQEIDHEEQLPPDTSVAHLASHDGSIFGLAAHPIEPLLVCSGAEDDLAYLWKIDTGEEVAKLSGHTDSVSAVGFSFDGELVATGGMDGKVRVWRRVQGQQGGTWAWAKWEFLTNLEGPDEVTTLQWHPRGNVLTVGSTDGTVWMWNLPSGKTMGVFAQHTAPITSLSWVSPSEGKRLLTTSEDATILLWSPADPSTPLHKFAVQADARFSFGMGPEDGGSGVTCSAVNAAGALAVVGGASNGALRILNLATGGFLASLVGGHAENCAISAVLWMPLGPTPGLWISAGTDGKICAWDVAHGSLRWTAQHRKTSEHPAPTAEHLEQQPEAVEGPNAAASAAASSMDVDQQPEAGADPDVLAVTAENAISTLALHSDLTHLTSAASNGTVITWEAKSGNQVRDHSGHMQAVHALVVSADGQAVVSAGDDGLGRVHLLAGQQQ